MKKKIKDEFMAGEMNLHDVFLYTRLLIARKNLTEFTKEFGLKSKGTLSYFEAGTVKDIMPEHVVTLFSKRLGVTTQKEMEQILKKAESYLKSPKPGGLDLSHFTKKSIDSKNELWVNITAKDGIFIGHCRNRE